MAFSAIGAAIFASSSVIQGQQAKQTQRRALRAQSTAQKKAESLALSEQRRSEQEQRRRNKKQPDLTGLLSNEKRAAKRGAASTLLTGPRGVDAERTTLGGGSALLGGR